MTEIRVLHQVNSLTIGGVETFVFRLAKHAKEKTFVYSHKDGPVSRWLKDAGIPVFVYSKTKDGKETNRIDEVIQQNNIDIIVMHTGSYYPTYALHLRKQFPKLKFISCMHTLCPGEPWVDRVIAVSKAVFDLQIDKGITRLVYPGIDRERPFIIGEVTRLAPYKFLADVVQVAELLAKEGIDFRVKIIGTEAEDAKGYLGSLITHIASKGLQGKFEFPGYVDKIDWDEFDAFIHLVGNREAYPVTLLEALDHNLPTFTYEGSGTKEIAEQYSNLMLGKHPVEVASMLAVVAKRRPKSMAEVAGEMSTIYNEVFYEDGLVA